MSLSMTAPMRSLKEFKGANMKWTQPKALVRQYELRSGPDLYATLTWVKTFGTLAEARTADGRFTLKRGGFLRPFVSIRDALLDSEVAVLKMGLLGHGTLEFTNGRRITLLSTRFWSFEWDMVDEGGQPLGKVCKRVTMFKDSADVTISEVVRRDRDLMLMLLASWYTMKLMSDEAAAAGAAGAS